MPGLYRRRLPGVVLVTLVIFLSSPLRAQNLSVQLFDNNDEPLVDAVIELFGPLGQPGLAEKMLPVVATEVDQVDKEFVPGVTTIVVGSSVSFPNSDDILHHVYSFSPAKTFDTPLYGRESRVDSRQVFDQPGVVEIGCNIHDWMLAYIYVGESPYMAISDDNGVATLDSLLPGDYELRIWHGRLAAPDNRMTSSITITAGDDTALELQVQLERERRIRRAPSSSRRRYR